MRSRQLRHHSVARAPLIHVRDEPAKRIPIPEDNAESQANSASLRVEINRRPSGLVLCGDVIRLLASRGQLSTVTNCGDGERLRLRPATSGPGGSCTHDVCSASSAGATTPARSARADLLLRAHAGSDVRPDPSYVYRGGSSRSRRERPAGGDSATSTDPKGRVRSAARAPGGGRLRRPGAGAARGHEVRTGGVEPPQPGATRLQRAELAGARRPHKGRPVGFEPTPLGSRPRMLPLHHDHHARWNPQSGFHR